MRSLIKSAISIFLLCISMSALAEEVRIDDGNRSLNANLELASGKTLEDGIILMLHGTLAHKDMEVMVLLQSVFHEYGYSSLAINLSFNIDDRHGFYPCERPHTHQYNDALAELDLWVHWLREQDVGDIVMFGHSRGANQVAKYLLQDEHPIVAGILLAPPTGSGTTSNTVQFNLDRAAQEDWLNDIDFLQCEGARVSAASYASYYGSSSRSNTPALLREISTPILVVSGSEDSTVPELAAKMKHVNNDLVEHLQIDGADHFFRDLFAYDVIDASIDFLNSTQQALPPE
jgi:pimeloyl-ACP methyl ester carboxylesterase